MHQVAELFYAGDTTKGKHEFTEISPKATAVVGKVYLGADILTPEQVAEFASDRNKTIKILITDQDFENLGEAQ